MRGFVGQMTLTCFDADTVSRLKDTPQILGSMKQKRVVVYGRVSTDAQNHTSQLREVRAYIRRRWPGQK